MSAASVTKIVIAALGTSPSPATATPVPPPGWHAGGWSSASVKYREPSNTRAEGALATIADFAHLPDGWSGYDCERPSSVAMEIASAIVRAMAEQVRQPDQVAPMADGGIIVQYRDGDRTVRLDIYNDGEAAIVTRSSKNHEPRYDDADPRDLPSMVDAFLRRD